MLTAAELVHIILLGFRPFSLSRSFTAAVVVSVPPRGLCTTDEEKKPKGVWPPFKVKTSARTPSENN